MVEYVLVKARLSSFCMINFFCDKFLEWWYFSSKLSPSAKPYGTSFPFDKYDHFWTGEYSATLCFFSVEYFAAESAMIRGEEVGELGQFNWLSGSVDGITANTWELGSKDEMGQNGDAEVEVEVGLQGVTAGGVRDIIDRLSLSQKSTDW